MPGDFPGGKDFDDFTDTLNTRLDILARELEKTSDKRVDFDFVLPIGLFLVIDEKNGGDVTGKELVRRFDLLNAESKTAIDFYFLGWLWREDGVRSRGIKFNLKAFEECRASLKKAGIKPFGGSSDLILVDVRYRYRTATTDAEGRPTPSGYVEIDLNFPKAIHINLSSSLANKKIPPIGELLQSIVAVAEDLQQEGRVANPVFTISDKLGLATAKQSFLDFILRKWGAIVGAEKLEVLAVRNVGPVMKLYGNIYKDKVIFENGEVPAVTFARGLGLSEMPS